MDIKKFLLSMLALALAPLVKALPKKEPVSLLDHPKLGKACMGPYQIPGRFYDVSLNGVLQKGNLWQASEEGWCEIGVLQDGSLCPPYQPGKPSIPRWKIENDKAVTRRVHGHVEIKLNTSLEKLRELGYKV